MAGRSKFYHTREQVDWCKGWLTSLGDKKLTVSWVVEQGIAEKFEQRFGRKITASGIYTWFRRVQDPEYGKTVYQSKKKKDKTKNWVLILEKSQYILYVFGRGIFGFDNKDEVREFVMKENIIEPMRLFVNAPIEVKRTVDITL